MIVAENLVKRFFWAGKSVDALKGVTFAVSPGEVFGLLGPNGAGKTTTLRIVMGLLKADGGSAEVGGVAAGPESLAVRANI
ncbi:MAG TPA: hypothetical protein DDW52_00500, partial [Planctomycetaceae bacterium]|nr:hypothetical protein [Planctomycetaceae bacterium]